MTMFVISSKRLMCGVEKFLFKSLRGSKYQRPIVECACRLFIS